MGFAADGIYSSGADQEDKLPQSLCQLQPLSALHFKSVHALSRGCWGQQWNPHHMEYVYGRKHFSF